MAGRTEHAIVISAQGRELRRRLGTTAWVALEDLLLDAHWATPSSVSVYTSARSLAERLGVSKDTAAAALRRLTAAGLARRESHRDVTCGVFARTVYVLDLDQLANAGVSLPGIAGVRPRRRSAAPAAGQAALFDTAPAAPA